MQRSSKSDARNFQTAAEIRLTRLSYPREDNASRRGRFIPLPHVLFRKRLYIKPIDMSSARKSYLPLCRRYTIDVRLKGRGGINSMTPKGSPMHSLSLNLRLKDLHKSDFYDIISIYIIGNQIICRKLCFLIHIMTH